METAASSSSSSASPSRHARQSAFVTRSLAQRNARIRETAVATTLQKSKFLQSTHPRKLPTVRREDVDPGDRLGRGASSDVYEILNGLDLMFLMKEADDDCENDDDDADDISFDHYNLVSQDLVMKQVRPDLNRQRHEKATRDLISEGHFLMRLQGHPHIIRLHGMSSCHEDEDESGVFLVLDRMDCTLADRIQEWKAQEESADALGLNNKKKILHFETKLRYARELASALEYLHEEGLMYRDLKPDNIGILNDSVVLFDFGTCRDIPQDGDGDGDDYNGSEVHVMSGVGTLPYMAPEVLQSQESSYYYNSKADVYSFAMVLYEIFFHIKPFELYSMDMIRLFVCDDEERPPIPTYCPTTLRDLLEDAWEADPLDRPAIPELRRALVSSSSSSTSSKSLFFWGEVLLQRSFSMTSSSERTMTTAALEDSVSLSSWFVSTG